MINCLRFSFSRTFQVMENKGKKIRGLSGKRGNHEDNLHTNTQHRTVTTVSTGGL